jgi:hypothetical protein
LNVVAVWRLHCYQQHARIAQYLSIGHNNQIYYSTAGSINCVKWGGTEVFSHTIPNEESHRKIAIDRNGNVHAAGNNANAIQIEPAVE